MVSAYHPDLDENSVMTEIVQQPLRYMARELDPITGLFYVRNRWYDPVANRFVSEDPIGLAGGINTYAYALNSPVNLRDPMGLDPTVEACIAQFMEQRNEGSLTWTDDQISKACGADNGSIVLSGVTASDRWDPFAQGNAVLARLMAQSDAMLVGLPEISSTAEAEVVFVTARVTRRAWIGCPEITISATLNEMETREPIRWNVTFRDRINVLGQEMGRYRGRVYIPSRGAVQPAGAYVQCSNGVSYFVSPFLTFD